MSENTLATRIEGRIDKTVSANTGITQTGAMAFSSVEQIMEFAKVMAIAGVAVPKHLRENVGACLAIAIQASEWQMSPFAVASKTYLVNDRLGFEAQLINAVILKRAPITGRFGISYSGEGASRKCKVTARLSEGGEVEYESPAFSVIPVKNSPLWKGDPDQQLFYYSSRAMCRRHFPDVILGVYTPEELSESIDIQAQVTPITRGRVGSAAAPIELAASSTTQPDRREPTSARPAPASEPTAPEAKAPEQLNLGAGTSEGPTLEENRAWIIGKLTAASCTRPRFVQILEEMEITPRVMRFEDLDNVTLQAVIDQWDELKGMVAAK